MYIHLYIYIDIYHYLRSSFVIFGAKIDNVYLYIFVKIIYTYFVMITYIHIYSCVEVDTT